MADPRPDGLGHGVSWPTAPSIGAARVHLEGAEDLRRSGNGAADPVPVWSPIGGRLHCEVALRSFQAPPPTARMKRPAHRQIRMLARRSGRAPVEPGSLEPRSDGRARTSALPEMARLIADCAGPPLGRCGHAIAECLPELRPRPAGCRRHRREVTRGEVQAEQGLGGRPDRHPADAGFVQPQRRGASLPGLRDRRGPPAILMKTVALRTGAERAGPRASRQIGRARVEVSI